MRDSTKETRDPDAMASIVDGLRKLGVHIDLEGAATPVRVVCIQPNLRDSVEALSESARDQVVMVRVDQETANILDAWVETGAVRSRSEAAALFIREGMKVRDEELGELKDALDQVEAAKVRLREKAKLVLGEDAAPRDG